ncbi:MAG: 4Fe-4S dicluster domain-containing protein [Rhodocyclaceae bacterium]|nr:4Fe-4S dicluster domain-containing protein [Rhodocyclaceae bacterium]
MAPATSSASVRLTSARLTSPFVAKIEKLSAQNLQACYQCGKCSAGCPMAAHMDILPNQVIRLSQLGMHERLLASKAIWICVSCMTCNTRCPKGVRIAETFEALRETKLRTAEREDYLSLSDISPEARAALPPIALISALRKLSS